MPPSGKRGGRGRGEGRGEGGGRQGAAAATSESKGAAEEPRRAGAGRGLPDYKENPRAKAAPQGTDAAPAQPDSEANGAEGSTAPAAQKFNAQEAADWMAQRYQAVMEEYDKQKAQGKKGDIQNFSDLNSERNAWGNSKPVLPPKEDFLHQLQMALAPFRTREGGEQKGSGSA